MAGNVKDLTSNDFDEAISSSELPILVDFWAEWCGPCRAVAPVLEEIADENTDKIQIAKLNVDENQDIAMRYSVRSIPTMLVFSGGEVTKTIVGAKGKADLLKDLELA